MGFRVLQEFQPDLGGGDNRQRHRFGEDHRGGVETNVLHDGLVAGNKAAQGADRFAERADFQVHLILDAKMGRGATAVRAENPCPMRVIDDQPGAIAALQFHQLVERSHVPLHAVDPIDHHRDRPRAGNPPENAFQVVHVIVSENANLCARDLRAADKAGMGIFVEDQQVAGAAQAGKRPHRGHRPRRKHQGRWTLFEGRNPVFQFQVRDGVARH